MVNEKTNTIKLFFFFFVAGEVTIPLWVLAAGPEKHNVALKNAEGVQVARLTVDIGELRLFFFFF